MAFSLLIGIPSGILAAVRVGRFWDRAGKVFSLLGLSLPSFWVGLVLILFFSVYLDGCRPRARAPCWHLLMPAFALGWYFAAAHMRLTRSSMLEVLGSEYIKLARLKGLPEALVIGKHAFKNALIPVLTLAGINLVIMINVAVVVETVFAWPGIGRLLYEGITFRDFPVVQARGAAGRRHDRGGEPADRHPLRRDRSAHPTGEVTAMAMHTEAVAPALALSPSSRLEGFPLHAGRSSSPASPSSRSSPTCSRPTIPRSAASPRASARPPGRPAAASSYLLGTDHLGPRRAVPADLRRPGVDGGRLHRGDLRRRASAPCSASSPATSAAGSTRSSCASPTPGWRCRR